MSLTTDATNRALSEGLQDYIKETRNKKDVNWSGIILYEKSTKLTNCFLPNLILSTELKKGGMKFRAFYLSISKTLWDGFDFRNYVVSLKSERSNEEKAALDLVVFNKHSIIHNSEHSIVIEVEKQKVKAINKMMMINRRKYKSSCKEIEPRFICVTFNNMEISLPVICLNHKSIYNANIREELSPDHLLNNIGQYKKTAFGLTLSKFSEATISSPEELASSTAGLTGLPSNKRQAETDLDDNRPSKKTKKSTQESNRSGKVSRDRETHTLPCGFRDYVKEIRDKKGIDWSGVVLYANSKKLENCFFPNMILTTFKKEKAKMRFRPFYLFISQPLLDGFDFNNCIVSLKLERSNENNLASDIVVFNKRSYRLNSLHSIVIEVKEQKCSVRDERICRFINSPKNVGLLKEKEKASRFVCVTSNNMEISLPVICLTYQSIYANLEKNLPSNLLLNDIGSYQKTYLPSAIPLAPKAPFSEQGETIETMKKAMGEALALNDFTENGNLF